MMNLMSTLILFSSFPLIHASSTTNVASPTAPTTSATSSVHTIDVGEDGLTFNPASLTVAPGDKVEFHFYSPEHSVAQASFANPCQPIGSGGFYSGLIRTAKESDTVFTLTVNNTDPIWYYCGAPGHCQAGMVGVINPPSSGSDTLDSFKSAAGNVKDTKVPANVFGGLLGTENSSSGNASSTTTGTSTGTSSASPSKTSSSTSASTTTNAASALYIAGDVSALMLLGLFSWLMI